jgi:hypothetical protein
MKRASSMSILSGMNPGSDGQQTVIEVLDLIPILSYYFVPNLREIMKLCVNQLRLYQALEYD